MDFLNGWLDYIRVLGFFVSLYSFVALLGRWKRHHKNWNVKTADIWYGLTMWTFSGCVFTAQAIYYHRPFTPGFVFLMAAIFVTGKGVHRRGEWGSNAS